MKKLLLIATAVALVPSAASAQLLGGGGLGGSLGGGLGGTVGSTIDSSTRTVRGPVDSTVRGSTRGDQSVNARDGSVSASRSAEGSANASSASLADLPVPAMFSSSASGNGSADGSANAQLIGTDAVTGAVAPVTGRARESARGVAESTTSTARGLASAARTPALPASGGGSVTGAGAGSGMGSLTAAPLAVAGSAAGQGNGAATVTPGMPVMTPDGASLGKVRQIVADSRGQVQQVVVQQGRVTRTLPAGMFSASGNALIAGEAQGEATGGERPETESGTAN